MTTRPTKTGRSTVEDAAAAAEDRPSHLRALQRARVWRRVGLGVMGAIVGAALLGLLGVRYQTVSDTDGTTTLTVRYPALGRPGLGITRRIDVERKGGFTGEVELIVDARYFGGLDENSLEPEHGTVALDVTVDSWNLP